MDFCGGFRFRLEAGLLIGALRGLAALPPALGREVGRGVGRLWGALARSRGRRALENLRTAFPEASAAQTAAWAHALWGELGQTLWEFARLEKMTPEEFYRSVDARGLDHVRSAFARGKGVLFFTAHAGNWEYAVPFLSLGGFPPAMIARRIKNPWVDAWVTAIRSRFGGRVIPNRNAVKESLRWLREGKGLGILFDQRITEGGSSLPFFGRPARTTTLPALLALRLGCPVLPIHTFRDNGRLVVECEPPMDIPPLSPTPENLARVMGQMTAVVEQWIRQRPDQWLWIHNRWKP